MALDQRQRIALTVVVAVVVVVAAGYVGLRESFALTMLPTDTRVSLGKTMPVAPSGPVFEAVRTAIEETSQGSTRGTATGKLVARGDMAGAGKPGGRMSAVKGKLTLRAGKPERKYRQRLLFDTVISIGFNDVDGDGRVDAWYSLAGKRQTLVAWGDGQGRFTGKQILRHESPGGAATSDDPVAFVDLDKDGKLDLVFQAGGAEGAAKPAGSHFWAKLEKARK